VAIHAKDTENNLLPALTLTALLASLSAFGLYTILCKRFKLLHNFNLFDRLFHVVASSFSVLLLISIGSTT